MQNQGFLNLNSSGALGSGTLTSWTDAVDTVEGVIITVTPDAPADFVEVKIPIALAISGELYARLNVVITP